jgi:hypothetical protein
LAIPRISASENHQSFVSLEYRKPAAGGLPPARDRKAHEG